MMDCIDVTIKLMGAYIYETVHCVTINRCDIIFRMPIFGLKAKLEKKFLHSLTERYFYSVRIFSCNYLI